MKAVGISWQIIGICLGASMVVAIRPDSSMLKSPMSLRQSAGGRELLQNGLGIWDWIYVVDPFAKFPPSPPPVYFPPPPPPPPFQLFPLFDILQAIPSIISGLLSIPGAVIDMIWNQATMYGPVVGDILRGDQAGAQQKIIDGELRKTMDINIILNGATQIALPFKQYTAPFAWISDLFG
eukprot:jgi/Botrbrau1/8740/Bobra.0090s0015.1